MPAGISKEGQTGTIAFILSYFQLEEEKKDIKFHTRVFRVVRTPGERTESFSGVNREQVM